MAGACDSGSRQKHLIRNRLITRNIMAIEQRIVNDSLTEIYVIGGDNFITQSRPTNFHQFFTRKILTPTEDISDYREVTAAERTALEQADAALQSYGIPDAAYLARVQKVFGMKWEKSPWGYYENYAKYDFDSGLFQFGSLKDISKVDMDIALSAAAEMHKSSHVAGCLRIPGLRFAVVPFASQKGYMFQYSDVEEVLLQGDHNNHPSFYELDWFRGASKLKVIEGIIGARDFRANEVISFDGCNALEEVRIIALNCNVNFGSSPNLSLSTINYILSNLGSRAAGKTITLHPTAYVRVTDELFALAAEKNITIAST